VCVAGLALMSATEPRLVAGGVVLLVLMSPWLRRAVGHSLSPRAARGGPPQPEPRHSFEPRVPLPRRPSQALPPLPTSVLGMSDEELCLAWRRSHVTVTVADPAGTKLATVSLRAAHLDEIERRDPDAFRAWLASGAVAAGSPHCFLDEEPPRGGSHAS
jgi:hypothetical protein